MPVPPPPSTISLDITQLVGYAGVVSGLITVSLDHPAGGGGLTVTLSDGGGGGTFTPGSVSIASGASSGTFTYVNSAPGNYTITASSGLLPPVSIIATISSLAVGPDYDIRFYDANLKRIHLPTSWVEQIDFDLLERGGYGQGRVSIIAAWDELALTGVERMDVYLWGELIYRAYLRTPARRIDVPEKLEAQCFGLVQLLDRWRIRKRYCYASPVDLFLLFADIVTDHVQVSGRLPSVFVETNAIGVSVQQFDAVGKSVAQALNAVCDLAPNQAIWGFDVSDTWYQGTPQTRLDRIYIRQKSQSVSRRYSIGGNVKAFVYPVDAAAVSNRIFITGGKVSNPNLLTNGSFERPMPGSELLGNLLQDYSFETGVPWTFGGGATRLNGGGSGAPRSQAYWAELDTNGEKVEQTVNLNSYQNILVGSFYARRESAGHADQVKGEVDGLDAGNALVVTKVFQAYVDPGDANYHHYFGDVDFTANPTVVKAKFRVQTNGGTASNDGIDVDDCGLWEKQAVENSGWAYALAGTANIYQLDWRSEEVAAYHGGYCVKAWPGGTTPGTNYLEIKTAQDARPRLQAGQAYTFLLRARASNTYVNIPQITIGIREYKADGTVQTTTTQTYATISTSWDLYAVQIVANINTVECEVFIRVEGDYPVFLDACMLLAGSPPAEVYDAHCTTCFWDGDTYETVIDTSNGAVTLAGAAATSLADWGEREDAVSSSAVVDWATAVAFAQGYFEAHATPRIEGQLQIADAREALKPNGLVHLLNLPSGPVDLFPARARYSITGSEIRIDADLGNERPDLAELLDLTAKRAATSGLLG